MAFGAAKGCGTVEDLHRVLTAVVDNVERMIVGKRRQVELAVTAMAGSGHVLIEDIPGVGKTSLVYALARSVACGFRRIQFTPDTMPSDITGFSVFNPKTGEFAFQPGAVMSNFILADEINRATPKTQASLLEIMEESQVTVDSHTYRLEQPFMVLATQNPVEYLGTYPLPEAQIDRFSLRISMGYPGREEEIRILPMDREARQSLGPVAAPEDILAARRAAAEVRVADALRGYIVDIAAATRSHPDVELGASPRGSIALYRMSQAFALLKGRDFVTPDDIKFLAPYVLAHRLILRSDAKIAGRTAENIVAGILGQTPVPVLP